MLQKGKNANQNDINKQERMTGLDDLINNQEIKGGSQGQSCDQSDTLVLKE